MEQNINSWIEKASNFEKLNERIVTEGDSKSAKMKSKMATLQQDLDDITSENLNLSQRFEELTQKYDQVKKQH